MSSRFTPMVFALVMVGLLAGGLVAQEAPLALPPSAWIPMTGTWEIDGDWLMEFTDASAPGNQPFWAVAGRTGMTNYRLEADVRARDGVGSIFLAARWQDARNHYLLRYSDPGQWVRLYHVRDGARFLLAEKEKAAEIGYRYETPVRLGFEVRGPVLAAYVNGTKVVEAMNSAYDSGLVALGEKDRQAMFRNVRVVPVAPPQNLPAVAKLEYAAPRRVYLREEVDAVTTVAVANVGGRPLTGAQVRVTMDYLLPKVLPLPTLAPGAQHVITYPIDTRALKAKRYRLKCEILKGEQSVLSDSFPVWIAPRINPQRLDVLCWDTLGSEDHEVKRMRELGFTAHLAGGFDTVALAKDPKAQLITERVRRGVDNGLKFGMEGLLRLHTVGGYPMLPETEVVGPDGKPQMLRGKRSAIANANHPKVKAMALAAADQLVEAMKPYPGFRHALLNTEIEDKYVVMSPSRDEYSMQRVRDEMGLKELPEPFTGGWSMVGSALRRNQAAFGVSEGVIADDNPYYRFLKWWWVTGNGYRDLDALFHDRLKKSLPHVQTFHDPAVRAPALLDRCKGVDMISHWTYTNPSPLKIGLNADEIIAAADGRQTTCQMIQLFWYAGGVLKKRTDDPDAAKDALQRQDLDFSGSYISISPTHLREATWMALSRAVDSIQYYGMAALTDKPGAYSCSNPHTVYEMERLATQLLKPYGPIFKVLEKQPTKVAYLESAASRFFGGGGHGGYAGGYQGTMYRTLLLAQVHPDMLFDETVQKRGLDGYDVLVIPEGHVMLAGVDAAIRKFVARGGLVIGDRHLKAQYPNTVRFPFLEMSEEGGEAYQKALVAKAAEFKALLKEKGYAYPVESDSPDVAISVREMGDSKYVFVINDRRRGGEYVGLYGIVLDEGVPQTTDLTLDPKVFGKGVLYDVLTQQIVGLCDGRTPAKTAVSLPPGGGKLLCWLPEAIAGLSVVAPPSVAKGQTVALTIQVGLLEGKAVPGAHPLQVTIRDGANRLNEYSGYYRATDGLLRLMVPVGVNDWGGYWQVQVRDLVGGAETVGAFLVK